MEMVKMSNPRNRGLCSGNTLVESVRLPQAVAPVEEAHMSNNAEQKARKYRWPPDQSSFSDCHHFVATMPLIPSVPDTCYVKLELPELTPAVRHPA